MTALPEHPVSHRLALFALCGDLVVAIDVMSIREIRPVEDTAARPADGAWLLDLDGERCLAGRQAGAVGDAEDVRVDRHRRFAEGDVENDVGGLATDSRQRL